jgi:hypothetical protein
MKLLARRETPTEQLKNVAIEVALSALFDGQSKPKDKPALTGVRAVAAGVVLYTAGWVAIKGRGVLRPEAGSRQDDDAGELSSEAATPRAKRKPVRRAARMSGPQPSLDLPQQRWPRMAAGRK